jgi:hypothetical protein
VPAGARVALSVEGPYKLLKDGWDEECDEIAEDQFIKEWFKGLREGLRGAPADGPSKGPAAAPAKGPLGG